MEVCPTEAIIFGDLDDPDIEVAKRMGSGKTEKLHPEYGLKEKVSYIGLPGRFVAGAAVFGDTDKCAGEVKVTLVGDGEQKTTRTDNYGDFEFEGLAEDKEYSVRIEHSGYETRQFNARTKIDIYLGEIVLSAKTRAKSK